MRTRTLVVLAIVAAALGALLIVDAQIRPTGADERAAVLEGVRSFYRGGCPA